MQYLGGQRCCSCLRLPSRREHLYNYSINRGGAFSSCKGYARCQESSFHAYSTYVTLNINIYLHPESSVFAHLGHCSAGTCAGDPTRTAAGKQCHLPLFSTGDAAIHAAKEHGQYIACRY